MSIKDEDGGDGREGGVVVYSKLNFHRSFKYVTGYKDERFLVRVVDSLY